MIQKISSNLYVSDMQGCKRNNKEDAILHCCKHPCFENAVGKKIGKDHPNYLSYENGNDLYLNIIDPDFSTYFYKETFDIALRFIDKHIKERKVVLHCNEGMSRSPQIAMLYLFRNMNYRDAQNRMLDIYNDYNPSIGIDEWLGYNWTSFQK